MGLAKLRGLGAAQPGLDCVPGFAHRPCWGRCRAPLCGASCARPGQLAGVRSIGRAFRKHKRGDTRHAMVMETGTHRRN
jgi:hypothetical protein